MLTIAQAAASPTTNAKELKLISGSAPAILNLVGSMPINTAKKHDTVADTRHGKSAE